MCCTVCVIVLQLAGRNYMAICCSVCFLSNYYNQNVFVYEFGGNVLGGENDVSVFPFSFCFGLPEESRKGIF